MNIHGINILYRLTKDLRTNLNKDITIEELESFLIKTKNNNTPGQDSFSYEFLKCFQPKLKVWLVRVSMDIFLRKYLRPNANIDKTQPIELGVKGVNRMNLEK